MSLIFVSYRRSDSSDVTGRIYDYLVSEFSREEVFKDVDSIPISVPFRNYVENAIKKALAVVVVIGPTWLKVVDDNNRPRLENPEDLVRIEVETALRLEVPTIPVVVSNALMPKLRDLPEALQNLCGRNGQPVRPDPDFHRDMERLVSRLRNLLGVSNKTNFKGQSIDSSLLELEEILKLRAESVEQWFYDNKIRVLHTFLKSGEISVEPLEAFRKLHKKHIEALQKKNFVLAHETLGAIHVLLSRYDAARYFMPPEYGYKYPGNLDSDNMYKLFKEAPPTIQAPLVKSLFVGMISYEYPPFQSNSFFQISLSQNTGISLVRAVVEQDIPMVQALLDVGIHPDIRVTSKKDEPKGRNSTPLMFAAQKGNKEIVEELLSKDATVDAQNELGETAEKIARKAGHTEIANLLCLSNKKIKNGLSSKKNDRANQASLSPKIFDILESNLKSNDVGLSPKPTVCGSCNGKGAVRCPQCRGISKLCAFCKGAGKVKCFLCGGSGYKN